MLMRPTKTITMLIILTYLTPVTSTYHLQGHALKFQQPTTLPMQFGVFTSLKGIVSIFKLDNYVAIGNELLL